MDPSEFQDGKVWKESFSTNHIVAAEEFTDMATELEDLHDFDAGPPKDDEQLKIENKYESFVIYSVISSVAYLEGFINEIFDRHMTLAQQIPTEEATEMADIVDSEFFLKFVAKSEDRDELPFWNNPIYEKYQFMLYYSDKDTFDTGREPYQNIKFLNSTRNYFVHYKPEMYSADLDREHIEHHIGSALQGKFDTSPFATDAEPFFPHHCLSASFAQWSIETSKSFTKEFINRLGIKPISTPATKHIEK